MLRLYLYAYIIVHKFRSLLSIRNESTLQRELPKFHVNNVFGKKIHQQQNKKTKQKLARARNWTQDLLHAFWRVISRPPNQMNISIAVKLFNCFYIMGRNINKKAKQKHLPEPGIEPRTSCIAFWRVTSRPPNQMNISIAVKLFNCFYIMGRNINKKGTKKHLPEPGIEPRTSCTAFWRVTSRPLNQMNISIAVKLFNCFYIMGRNINKQSYIRGHFFWNT